jgi:uncharacterized membrane protein
LLIDHKAKDPHTKDMRMNAQRANWIIFALYLVASVYGVAIATLKIPQVIPITPINTILGFSFAVQHARQREGGRRALLLAVVVFLTGLVFESVGVATGWVYGPYHYTDLLGPKFLGLVPYMIPLAWTMMMYPAMVIADGFVPHSWGKAGRFWAVAAIAGVVMTAWDVAMDPMMVAGGHWVWEVQGAYFGVPLQNFWGWWLTTFVAMAIYQLAAPRIPDHPVGVPDRWAVWAYCITAGSTILVELATGLGGPALAGIFAMTPWIISGIIQTVKANPSRA